MCHLDSKIGKQGYVHWWMFVQRGLTCKNQSLSCHEAVHKLKNTASTPSPFPVIWIAARKSTLEARWAQLCSQQLRQKLALRHNNVCSCFCAHLSAPTWTLLPSLWSTGDSIPAARMCPSWSLQHSSDCWASIPHPTISKLPSGSSKINTPITVNQKGFTVVIWGSLLSSRAIPISKRQPLR